MSLAADAARYQRAHAKRAASAASGKRADTSANFVLVLWRVPPRHAVCMVVVMLVVVYTCPEYAIPMFWLWLFCAGFAYAPLLATRLVCGRLARPAALVGAAAAAVRGVLRFVSLRGLSPSNLLKQLQEAALTFGGNCLEVGTACAASGWYSCARSASTVHARTRCSQWALQLCSAQGFSCLAQGLRRAFHARTLCTLTRIAGRALLFMCVSVAQAVEKIAERAASSPRWRRAFVKLGGIEALLKMLRGGLDADTVRAVMKALAELLKESTAQDVSVQDVAIVVRSNLSATWVNHG